MRALRLVVAGLLAAMLGASTPKADPSGDYAWAVFRQIDGLRPGSFETLDRKALS